MKTLDGKMFMTSEVNPRRLNRQDYANWLRESANRWLAEIQPYTSKERAGDIRVHAERIRERADMIEQGRDY